ncbi:hypothetical protein HPP92_012882 [Vanilla planifolia]|uniref:Uncharacterized protein n=1 Tax=Vanilla planifolia TaxID=51239 RepID=A0A835UYA0_VANPL|nr:hypothetical protein HPP92_012882 [Vanilla planifolia]
MAFGQAWFTKSKKSCRRRSGRRGTSAEDPSSPRVGCWGQVKRCKLPPPPPPYGIRGVQLFADSASTTTTSSSSSMESSPTASIRGKPAKAVEEMDPPLPVMKKENLPAESLWRRRSRGVELGELRLRRLPEVLVEGTLFR